MSYQSPVAPAPDPARLRLLAEGADKIYKLFIVRIVFDLLSLVLLLVTAVTAIGVSTSITGAAMPLGQNWTQVSTVYTGAGNISGVLAAYGLLMLLGLVAAVITLYFLYTGMRALSGYDAERYDIGFLGAKLWVGGILGTVVGLVVLVASAAARSIGGVVAGFLVLAFSGIAVLAATVLVLIALWRLGGEPGGDSIRLGIGLLIAAIVAGLLAAALPALLVLAVALQLAGELALMLGAKRVRDAALERMAAASFNVTA